MRPQLPKRTRNSSVKKAILLLAGGIVLERLSRSLREPFRYRGKVALVSGGSRGLGYLLARGLLERGCKVAFCARNVDGIMRAERELKRIGSEVVGIPCDLTIPEDCKRFVADALGRFGRIDILVNNAGVIVSGPEHTMTGVDYKELMDVHFWGPYHLIETARREMRQRGGGSIVNITSIGGKVPVPHLLPYTASKFALRGYSEALRAELSRENIIVTTICPGLMRTGSQVNASFKGDHEREYAWFRTISAIPGVSVSAESAARRILLALERGEGEVVLGTAAKAADLFYGIAPNLFLASATLANSLLPEGRSEERRQGKEIPLSSAIQKFTGNIDRAGQASLEQ